MGYIYKITNNINNKVYIGQTIRTIMERWSEHKTESKRIDKYPNNKFYNALRYYGVDNFTIEEVESCDNNILDDREIYWINYYNSISTGYNSDIGGHGGDCGEAVNQYTIGGKYITTYPSASEAARVTGCNRGSICACARQDHNTRSVNGYQWRYTKDITPNTNIPNLLDNPKVAKTVSQYDLENNYIATYPSIAAAAKAVGRSHTSISQCIRGISKTSANCYWRVDII